MLSGFLEWEKSECLDSDSLLTMTSWFINGCDFATCVVGETDVSFMDLSAHLYLHLVG